MAPVSGTGWDHGMLVAPSRSNAKPELESFIANLTAKMKRGGMMTPEEAHYLIDNGYTEFGGVSLNRIIAPRQTSRYGM